MPGPAVIWVLEKSVDDPKTYHLSMRLGKRLPRKWPKRVEEEEIATLAVLKMEDSWYPKTLFLFLGGGWGACELECLICEFWTRWWQLKYFVFSPRKIGEMIHFDLHIFFRWVGSTTN